PAPLTPERGAEARMSFGVIRLHANGLAVGRLRLGVLVLLLEHRPEIEVALRVIRPEAQGLAIRHLRLGGKAPGEERRTQGAVRERAVRLHGNRLTEGLDRLAVPALLAQQLSEIGAGARIARLET